jgi:hypothetical protein
MIDLHQMFYEISRGFFKPELASLCTALATNIRYKLITVLVAFVLERSGIGIGSTVTRRMHFVPVVLAGRISTPDLRGCPVVPEPVIRTARYAAVNTTGWQSLQDIERVSCKKGCCGRDHAKHPAKNVRMNAM